MVKTCCLYDCKTNYRTERKDNEVVSVDRFPNKKNMEERQRWIDVVKKINANLEIGDETVICSRHWPKNCSMIRYNGKERPSEPPSVFENIPKSIIPPPPPPPRSTQRTSCHERNRMEDELDSFYQLDTFNFQSLKEQLISNTRNFMVMFKTIVYENALYLQSESFFDGIPYFVLKICSELKYEAFHLGVKVYIPSLNRNRVSKLGTWSCLEEALRYLSLRDIDYKTEMLQE